MLIWQISYAIVTGSTIGFGIGSGGGLSSCGQSTLQQQMDTSCMSTCIGGEGVSYKSMPRKWNHLEFLCELVFDLMGF